MSESQAARMLAVFESGERAEQVMSRLARAAFDLRPLSVIGVAGHGRDTGADAMPDVSPLAGMLMRAGLSPSAARTKELVKARRVLSVGASRR